MLNLLTPRIYKWRALAHVCHHCTVDEAVIFDIPAQLVTATCRHCGGHLTDFRHATLIFDGQSIRVEPIT